ncbi:hypothetical protein [Loktanella salsilacus]|uniref:hypothetical protein n=1 Tax=Loktanella salsilacus TaxID=195913 RepID=UPI003734F6F3
MKLSLKKAISIHEEALRRIQFARRTVWYTEVLPSHAASREQFDEHIQKTAAKAEAVFNEKLAFLSGVYEIGRMIKKAHQLHGVIDLQSEIAEIKMVLMHFPVVEGPLTRGTKATPDYAEVSEYLLKEPHPHDAPRPISLMSQAKVDEMTERHAKLTARIKTIESEITTINAIGYIYPSPETVGALTNAGLISLG